MNNSYLESKAAKKVVGWIVKTFVVTATAVLTAGLLMSTSDPVTVIINLCDKDKDVD